MEENIWTDKSVRIANKVVAALAERKMSKQALAALLGVSPQYVSKIVKGGENLTLETISKLEKALGIPLTEAAPKKFVSGYVVGAPSSSSFQRYNGLVPNPSVRIRKALVFEDNIPDTPEPAELRLRYQTKTGFDLPAGEVSVVAQTEYQYESKLCADIEITLKYAVEELRTLVRRGKDGELELTEGLMEELLTESFNISRGFAAAVLGTTPLRDYPVPACDAAALAACNCLQESR